MRSTICGIALLAGVCALLPEDAGAGARNGSEAIESLVRRGSAAWTGSCASGGALCVRSRAFRSRWRCTGGATRVWVLARSPRGSAGQATLRRAVKLYRRVTHPDARVAAAVAPALLYLADADHERFLRTRFPRHLSFDPADGIGYQLSLIRFKRWLANLQSNVAHLTRAYREAAAVAVRGNRPDLVDQAQARAAAMFARAAALLSQARIPRSFAGKKWEREMTASYCGEVSKQAQPWRHQAAALRQPP